MGGVSQASFPRSASMYRKGLEEEKKPSPFVRVSQAPPRASNSILLSSIDFSVPPLFFSYHRL